MKNTYTLTMSVLVLLISISCQQNAPQTFDVSGMDLNVAPSSDFDNYANGGWKINNPLPADKARFGTFDQLRDEAEKQLQSLFEKVSSMEHEQGSVGQKIADFFLAGMDSTSIETLGAGPLEPFLRKIKALSSVNELNAFIAEAHASGNGILFSFYGSADRKNSEWVIAQLYQGGLGISDSDYYLNSDTRSSEIRQEYLVHISRMFQLTGDDSLTAKNKAHKVMALETRLASASMTRLERRDPHKTYNKMDIRGLVEIAPALDWASFFTLVGLTQLGEINVGMPEFFKEVNSLIEGLPLEDWKAYLSWHTISSAAPYLSSAFVDENFRFYGKVMQGQEENRLRWKRVQGTVNGSLSEAIGQLYVAEYFPPKAKKRMLNLVENLRISLGKRIENLEWMSGETQQKAQEKLTSINVKIGYPDQWRDYSGLEIAKGAYYENVLRARKFNAEYNRGKINKPVDKGEWFMSPQTVNAYYNPSMNEIVFPAAILQPPFFYLDADDALNYGAIGVVIGHEMTHGFDDQGRKYDAKGNLNNWWTEEDSKRFEERTQVLIDQYNEFPILDSLFADGKLTLGENIADLGGLNISYQAFQEGGKKTKPIDGFTSDQRFFLSYARIWANNTRERELQRLTKEDVHSIGRWRVMGPLRNMPEFHKAFSIQPGSFMYLDEGLRASIW